MTHPIVEHIPRLRRYARALTGSPFRADDLVQDTLERAFAKWHLWRTGTNLRAWLFAIMHNLFVNQLEATRHDREALPLEDAPEPATPPTHDILLAMQDVARALEQLPPEQREVLLLVALEDLKYEEVARVLQVPIGTVMSRLSRARERLRKIMSGDTTAATSLKAVK
jgi:RNA polymerase sigma-70 factor (ECF subfamily)